jgi:hypothetical protein
VTGAVVGAVESVGTDDPGAAEGVDESVGTVGAVIGVLGTDGASLSGARTQSITPVNTSTVSTPSTAKKTSRRALGARYAVRGGLIVSTSSR